MRRQKWANSSMNRTSPPDLTWSKAIGYHGVKTSHDANTREPWVTTLGLPFHI